MEEPTQSPRTRVLPRKEEGDRLVDEMVGIVAAVDLFLFQRTDGGRGGGVVDGLDGEGSYRLCGRFLFFEDGTKPN